MVAAQAQLLLSLQKTAGNRAACGEIQRLREGLEDTRFLQRNVSINNGKTWIKENAKLDDPPSEVLNQYQQYVIDRAKNLARDWRDDDKKTDDRKFVSHAAFYQTLCHHIVTQGQPNPAQSRGSRWKLLGHAVNAKGGLNEVPWSSFPPYEANELERELVACQVQHSSNPNTTACHGNDHQKLPRKVPDGLTEMAHHEQPRHTPYIEFLVGGQKSDTGIERGILDRELGQIYLTAHYDAGSIVWLSGAPENLVKDWQEKAEEYCKSLTG